MARLAATTKDEGFDPSTTSLRPFSLPYVTADMWSLRDK